MPEAWIKNLGARGCAVRMRAYKISTHGIQESTLDDEYKKKKYIYIYE